jgi:hypothetical protein
MWSFLFQRQNETFASNEGVITKLSECSLNHFIKELCLKNLMTLNCYKLQVFNVFNANKRLPVYLSKDILLIPLNNINSYDIIYLNYFKIKRYTIFNKSVKIFMGYGEVLQYRHHIKSFMKLISLAKNIIKIKEGKTNG